MGVLAWYPHIMGPDVHMILGTEFAQILLQNFYLTIYIVMSYL